ncbi:Regulator of telomere elongation helicase 1 [Chlorella sorokiniana]|uniref:Regulator of telomere elongation helicase 1 homolog n=1 Tax=Chlorella sorokiniana TaxID=3076 RepID=A0A2P6TL03_CHLSO|nr:Regulator of telomere elongation helicase 1 [Chlorella sorokiniana]|eukprot:PRW44978.1 Regulator of telomere elongation helicase 1 [Chlorella sorokiniana]
MPTYTLSGIEVEFPYDAYPCQLAYMAKVVTALQQGQHALLESPTGTGKTLCLLCATLAWRQSMVGQAAAQVELVQQQPHSSTLVQGLREAWAEHRAAAAAEGGPASGLPQIVYSSRTHSQLQQVMRELKKLTVYKPRTATVASRQHGCLHPTVSTMQSGANQACRALVSKRACKWYNGVEKFMRQNPDVNAEVLDIEDLGRIGESRSVCPYYLAREMAATADIVFMPYNYLIDAKTRGGLGIQWANAVLIFDEAHNVEQVCSDSMSFDLPAATLAGAIEELGTAAEVAANKGEAPVNIFNTLGEQDRNPSFANVSGDLHRGRAVLCRLEQEIAKLAPSPDNGLTRPGAFLFELLARCGITPATWHILFDCLQTATSILTEEAVEAGRRSGSRGTSYSLHAVGEALRLAFNGTAAMPTPEDMPQGAPGPGGIPQQGQPGALAVGGGSGAIPPWHTSYKVHVHLEKNKSGRQAPTLSYWCFSPGLSMKQITEMRVRSILLTSGTLSPLDSFAHELGLAFPVRLENGHVIGREQVWCGVVPAGPSGQPLNSSYQNRDNPAYRNDLGMALVNFGRIIPDGLLVFFPSYALLQSCIASWKQQPSMGGPSIWERIAKTKQPVVEPRESAAFNAAAEDFRNKLANPAYNGAIFFAVTRGKASEGLDFSDAAGRAVVLTGIPYPMKMDPKVRLKQEALNEARSAPRKRSAGGPSSGGSGGGSGGAAQGLSGDQWYSQSAMRAVNQAVGRVIRHRRDYGAIILCDERFRAPNVQRQLSCWLRDQVSVYPNYGAANAALVQFFKQQAEAARQGLVDGGQSAVAGATRPSAASALLAPAAGSKAAAGPFQGIGGGGGSGRSLLQSVPTAIDAVGITELFAPMATAAAAEPAPAAQQQQQQQQQAGTQEAAAAGTNAAGGGASRLLSAVGRGGGGTSAPARQVSGQTAAGAAAVDSLLSELGAPGPQRGSGAGGSSAGGSKQFEPRPWERAALAASARPCPPRAPAPPAAAPGGGGPAGNIVGPAHLVAKHAEQQRSRSCSAEPDAEQAQQAEQEEQQPDAAGCPAAMETDQPAEQAPAERAQQGAQPPAQQQQQQQAAAGQAGSGAGGTSREQTVAAYLGQLKAALSKEQFTAMRAELQAYSKGKELARLMAAALPLLQPHPALLEGFATFVPKSARPQLQQRIQQIKAPIESPHQSGCGHSACYGCWLKALATFKPCPVCAKPVRKAQLTKLHFV